MKNHGSRRSGGNRSGVPITALALAMALAALFCLGTEALAVRPELKLHSRDYPKNNYIGGSLPVISLADIYFENKTEPGRYCFKFIFSRIGRDKGGKLKKGTYDDPTGALFMGRGVYWKDILHLCPKFQRGAPEIWPQLRGKMIPPIRFNVTYKVDYWEVTQKYGSWVPVKGVNWATSFPISQEKWESLGGGKIRLIQDRRGGLAPGRYMIRIRVLAKLDQRISQDRGHKSGQKPWRPGSVVRNSRLDRRFGHRRRGTLPPAGAGQGAGCKGHAMLRSQCRIKKRRLEPVARGNLRSGNVTKMGPAPGTWWWKGKEIHLVCGPRAVQTPMTTGTASGS